MLPVSDERLVPGEGHQRLAILRQIVVLDRADADDARDLAPLRLGRARGLRLGARPRGAPLRLVEQRLEVR